MAFCPLFLARHLPIGFSKGQPQLLFYNSEVTSSSVQEIALPFHCEMIIYGCHAGRAPSNAFGFFPLCVIADIAAE